MKPRIWFLYPFLLVLFLAGAWVGCSTTEPAKIPARNAGEVMVDTLLGRTPIEFVWIEPGTFIMGSPESGAQRGPNEGPQHQVTISQGFWLGKYEVTQGQWEAVMGTRPWAGEEDVRSNANHSAVYISWEEVQQLIQKLNQAEGEGVYRLPTEAEWEYACWAGTTTRWSFGDDEKKLGDYAWYKENAWGIGERYAHAVGQKLSYNQKVWK